MNHCLNTTWQPCPASHLKLKQWGFTKGRVIDLLSRYKKLFSPIDYCDKQFLKFCTQHAADIVADVLTVSRHWQPSKSAIEFLTQAGVPVGHIHNQYVPYFISDFTNKNITQVSWDRAFVRFALSYWSADPANPSAKVSLPIKADWFPCEQTIKTLCQQTGLSKNGVIQKGLEFRLYWRDVGSSKLDWDKAFMDWMNFCVNDVSAFSHERMLGL